MSAGCLASPGGRILVVHWSWPFLMPTKACEDSPSSAYHITPDGPNHFRTLVCCQVGYDHRDRTSMVDSSLVVASLSRSGRNGVCGGLMSLVLTIVIGTTMSALSIEFSCALWKHDATYGAPYLNPQAISSSSSSCFRAVVQQSAKQRVLSFSKANPELA